MFPNPPTNDDTDESALIRPETGEELVTISLLKQYSYCPRIVYYESCTPGIRPRTYKMDAGQDAHARERNRAARRTLAAYHLPEGERRFDVRLISMRLHLSGIVDEIVVTPEEAVIIDYKMSSWAGDNHMIQLGAYALLVEEVLNVPVHRGFVYLMNVRRFESVSIDAQLRNSVMETLKNVERIRVMEYMPPPVEQPNKCESCEFRRFCNDV